MKNILLLTIISNFLNIFGLANIEDFYIFGVANIEDFYIFKTFRTSKLKL